MEKLLRWGCVCDSEWCFHAVCSCFLTPPTSRLDEPPLAPSLRPRLASSTCLPGPAHYSTLALWTPPFSTQAPPSEHRLHTCDLGQRQRDYCRVLHHGASPPPKCPGTESITSTSLPPWLQKSLLIRVSFSVCECAGACLLSKSVEVHYCCNCY